MSQADFSHQTVLLHEAVAALLTDLNGHYVDGTFGRGGHSRAILQKLQAQGRLTAFDRDPQAVAVAQQWQDPRFDIRHAIFSELGQLPAGSAQGVLLDLGISSPQIDDAARGFSFRNDGPLDMRMDPTAGQSVSEWLLQAEESQLAQIIRDYGEERFAKPIAKAIVARVRAQGAIAGTAELAQLIAGVVKTREGGQHPATRTFQALRIFINGELDQVHLALAASMQVLAPGGRLVVISFHSLEDRIVKQFMQAQAKEQQERDDMTWMLRQQEQVMPLHLLDRIKPSAEEVRANPRSRSAIMRVAERTAAPLRAPQSGGWR
jgi:16S rRNA (cytosine1402-N4)-methyltransferase